MAEDLDRVPRTPEQIYLHGICARLDAQNQLLADLANRLAPNPEPEPEEVDGKRRVELREPATETTGEDDTQKLAEPETSSPAPRPPAKKPPAKTAGKQRKAKGKETS